MGVTGPCSSRDAGPAGVGQPQCAGNLVKGFAGGVVHRAAQHLVAAPVLHHHNVAVATAGHQTEKRRFQVRMGQIVCRDMSPQMVYRHQRFAAGVGKALGKVDTHQHRADQARGKGDSHRIHVGHGHARVGQGFFHRGTDIFNVAAAGDLRHHTAVKGLLLDAGADHVGDQRPAVLHNGGGRLVAGRFNTQNIHLFFSPTIAPAGETLRRGNAGFCLSVSPVPATTTALHRCNADTLYRMCRFLSRPGQAISVPPARSCRCPPRRSAAPSNGPPAPSFLSAAP